MSTTALGIMQDSAGNGVDPLTHRRIIKGRWANTGVIEGLEVTGTSTLAYRVGPGNAVLSRGDSDGYTEAYWEGGTTPAVTAGNASNPRIDLVWMRANDLQQGDPDNHVEIGVAEGTPSASPIAPSVPSGCTEIAQMRLPAGSTTTANATANANVSYAISYGSTLGLLGSTQDTTTRSLAPSSGTYTTACSTSFTVPTDRLVELDLNIAARSLRSDGSTGGEWLNYAFLMLYLQMDGSNVEGGSTCFVCFRAAQTFQLHTVCEVSAGTHTARVRYYFSDEGSWGRIVYQDTDALWDDRWCGTILRVWDRGIAQ